MQSSVPLTHYGHTHKFLYSPYHIATGRLLKGFAQPIVVDSCRRSKISKLKLITLKLYLIKKTKLTIVLNGYLANLVNNNK